MKALLTAILLGAGNVVAISVLKLLESTDIAVLLAVIVAACTGIVLTKVGEYLLLELPLRFRLLRGWMDPRASMEGRWLEHVEALTDNPYTVLTIAYNPVARDYRLTGRNFDVNGQQMRTFESQHVSIAPSRDQIIYTYDANQGGEQRSDAVGICYMSFQRDSSGRYEGGGGYFFNRDPEARKYDFSFKRAVSKRGESDAALVQRTISQGQVVVGKP